ncbi:winged helix-turn-helix domain-containing protein [Pararobbsia silviterrae]|uniref:OmpR/PhoB-type domain-containing protein n=1 Tax=Pararobbsia silviterrae TaxID=1792498 RepID=A0A494XHX2_9BURK|nr:winged helix-turn-helix domain-containing protein [Pararobbsia silviterrae]RKP47684.1 hypothetical protein D7S86_22200 [Pararobbsia silviterrae]
MRILIFPVNTTEARYLAKGLIEIGHSVEVVGAASERESACARETFDVVIRVTDVLCETDWIDERIAPWRVCASDAVTVIFRTRGERVHDVRMVPGTHAVFDMATSFHEFHEAIVSLHRELSPLRASRLDALDTKSSTYRAGGKICRLTRQELLLMECLLRDGADPVTWERIMRYVWPGRRDVRRTNLTIVASRLRSKLQQARFEANLIAVRGVGYRFAPTC